jgi:hypothetical protein
MMYGAARWSWAVFNEREGVQSSCPVNGRACQGVLARVLTLATAGELSFLKKPVFAEFQPSL